MRQLSRAGLLGRYRWSGVSSLFSATFGATSEIFQFRWAPVYLLFATKYDLSAAVGGTTFTLTAGGYTAGTALTLTASNPVFQGTAADVGRKWRVLGSDGSVLDLTITVQSSTTVCTVTSDVNIPAVLQATATANWWFNTNIWTGQTCLIERVRISMAVETTVVYAQGGYTLNLAKCNGWTAKSILGVTPSIQGQGKKHPNYDNTLQNVMGEIRITGTDNNGLGTGTKTVQNNALLGSGIFNAPTAVPQHLAPYPTTLFDVAQGDSEPIALGFQEGITIYVGLTPGTGRPRATVEVDWSETVGATG